MSKTSMYTVKVVAQTTIRTLVDHHSWRFQETDEVWEFWAGELPVIWAEFEYPTAKPSTLELKMSKRPELLNFIRFLADGRVIKEVNRMGTGPWKFTMQVPEKTRRFKIETDSSSFSIFKFPKVFIKGG